VYILFYDDRPLRSSIANGLVSSALVCPKTNRCCDKKAKAVCDSALPPALARREGTFSRDAVVFTANTRFHARKRGFWGIARWPDGSIPICAMIMKMPA